MRVLTEASTQWSTRPADERFSSLEALHENAVSSRNAACVAGVRAKSLRAEVFQDKEVVMVSPNGNPAHLSNWSFAQFATQAGAPATYLRTLPAALAAKNINTKLAEREEDEKVVALFDQRDPNNLLTRCITSEKYSRIWDADLTIRFLDMQRHGWHPAPAAFDGSRGLYRGDRDMFVYMVDNDRKIFEKKQDGGLSRGFFCWNSEVGASRYRMKIFLYEWTCGNHRVWGASQVKEVSIRHIGKANIQAMSEFEMEFKAWADSSAGEDEAKIEAARTYRFGATKDEILDAVFKMNIPDLPRKTIAFGYDRAVEREDRYGDPSSAWGIAGGLTELATEITFADERNTLEHAAGKVMEIAW